MPRVERSRLGGLARASQYPAFISRDVLPSAEHQARFWSLVDSRDADGCWPWLGMNCRGYGKASVGGQRQGWAHRIAYTALVGPIPEGLVIDHLCRNPACVNPAHLQPVTSRENTLRGESPAAQRARLTVCLRGHDLSDAFVTAKRHSRVCRQCSRDANDRVRERMYGPATKRCARCGALVRSVQAHIRWNHPKEIAA